MWRCYGLNLMPGIKGLERVYKIPDDKLIKYMIVISVKNEKNVIQLTEILGNIFKRMTGIKKNQDILSNDDTPSLVSAIRGFNNLGVYLDYLADKWYTLKAMEKKHICEIIAGESKDDFRILMDGYYKPCNYIN